MNHDWHDLIQRYIAGTLPDDDALALQNALKSDKDLRALYLDYMNLDVALGSHAESRAAVNEILASPMAGETSRPTRWLSWRPLTAAAAGIMLGMFCTSVVFGYVGPRVAEKVRPVFSEGFESGVSTTAPGLPRVAGLWSGDEAEAVNATPAMKARSGGKMLRFLSATYPGEDSPRSQWSDVYRLVDVRGLAGAGRTVARLSASFAQDILSPEERFAGRAEALAIDRELSAVPTPLSLAWLQQNNSAMGSRRAVLTSARTWQDVSVEVPITRETRYVVLHLAMVQEQPYIHSGAVQFAGHFMDDVKLEIISRP